MWQNLAVGAIVALAGLYALWYWMPAALRKRPVSPGATGQGRKTVWMASRH